MNVFFSEPIVSVHWLTEHLNASNLIVLNATILSVTSKDFNEESNQIPNARFFDIKSKFSIVGAEFPNTFPTELQFNREAQTLGINSDSAIVIYDEKGIYSSARAWWLFKSFGHNNVSILDGGLPEWKKQNYKIELKEQNTFIEPGNFQGKFKSDHMCFFDSIIDISERDNSIIIDARSKQRFFGKVPEPRIGLRSGTLPNSKNLPYNDVLRNGKLKPISELKAIFAKLARLDDHLYFSCGSGITACILALAASQIGYKNCTVYDGSWTEYGSLISK